MLNKSYPGGKILSTILFAFLAANCGPYSSYPTSFADATLLSRHGTRMTYSNHESSSNSTQPSSNSLHSTNETDFGPHEPIPPSANVTDTETNITDTNTTETNQTEIFLANDEFTNTTDLKNSTDFNLDSNSTDVDLSNYTIIDLSNDTNIDFGDFILPGTDNSTDTYVGNSTDKYLGNSTDTYLGNSTGTYLGNSTDSTTVTNATETNNTSTHHHHHHHSDEPKHDNEGQKSTNTTDSDLGNSTNTDLGNSTDTGLVNSTGTDLDQSTYLPSTSPSMIPTYFTPSPTHFRPKEPKLPTYEPPTYTSSTETSLFGDTNSQGTVAKEGMERILAAVLTVAFLLMVLTAQQMKDNPHGLCAAFCNVTIMTLTVLLKIICLPCKFLCQGRRHGAQEVSTNRMLYEDRTFHNDLSLELT